MIKTLEGRRVDLNNRSATNTTILDNYPSLKSVTPNGNELFYIRGLDLLYFPNFSQYDDLLKEITISEGVKTNYYPNQVHLTYLKESKTPIFNFLIFHELSHVQLLNYTFSGKILYDLSLNPIGWIEKICDSNSSIDVEKEIEHLKTMIKAMDYYTESLKYVVEPIANLEPCCLSRDPSITIKIKEDVFDIDSSGEFNLIQNRYLSFYLRLASLVKDKKIGWKKFSFLRLLPIFISTMPTEQRLIGDSHLHLMYEYSFKHNTSPKLRMDAALNSLRIKSDDFLMRKSLNEIAKYIIEYIGEDFNKWKKSLINHVNVLEDARENVTNEAKNSLSVQDPFIFDIPLLDYPVRNSRPTIYNLITKIIPNPHLVSDPCHAPHLICMKKNKALFYSFSPLNTTLQDFNRKTYWAEMAAMKLSFHVILFLHIFDMVISSREFSCPFHHYNPKPSSCTKCIVYSSCDFIIRRFMNLGIF